jgi:uncharacterized damage-inducible protein DinB
MNADDIRLYYDYHFALNRRLWDESVMTLTDEQFTRQIDYSVGSVRNQVVHLMNIDDRWFSGLRGEEVPGFANPVYYPGRAKIREQWDSVETRMREYLAKLTDDQVNAMFDEDLKVWQVLLHVLNHGTDHRAQTLSILHSLGAPTFPQDYVIHLWRLKECK